MDLYKAVESYVSRMLGTTGGKTGSVYDSGSNKMKIILLDSETTSIISMVSTQSLLLQNEVYLIDRLDNPKRERMRHLKCVVFVRPTGESVQQLIEELREPKYGEYELFFSNIIKKSSLERVAEADDYEVVKSVQEVFADYLVINRDLFTMNLQAPDKMIFGDAAEAWSPGPFMRSVEGIMAACLALKKRPVIRFEANSAMAKSLAIETQYNMQQEPSLFDFRRTDTPPTLLILDRKNDPVTPLLTPWTYQAMVHHFLGIKNGRVDLSGVPDARPDMKEIVLSPEQDPFYKQSMFMNFGDLGASIKEFVDNYQSKTKSNMNIESIADMKRFVEEYPEFRKLSGNVTKHVTLVSEISRLVDLYDMLEIGQLEQSLACRDTHNQDLKLLRKFLGDELPHDVKVRLVALYGLRYERMPNNAFGSLCGMLASLGVSDYRLDTLRTLVRYAGADERQEDLFAADTIFRGPSGFKGVHDVENVYTQHTTLLERTLSALLKGRLREAAYPFLESGAATRDKPQDIIVYFVGGATYAEARLVAKINEGTPGVRIVLGGTTVHSSTSFMDDLAFSAAKWAGASIR
ncbi:Sec1-like protein [Dipodascopsis tothii]|uniref:Sec1-like protein n=1 Tax=Dipodascopsis tothii TaxID=44089 RepID=UPI0034CFE36A